MNSIVQKIESFDEVKERNKRKIKLFINSENPDLIKLGEMMKRCRKKNRCNCLACSVCLRRFRLHYLKEHLPIWKKLMKQCPIRLLCGEVLAQHKTDDELQKEGLKLLKKALKREYLVTVKQKGKKFSDDEKMAFGFKIMRDSLPNRHFIAIRKSQFDSVFTSQYQADLMTRYLKNSGVLVHKQVDFVDFGERPQFHCLNMEKLRKEGLYK